MLAVIHLYRLQGTMGLVRRRRGASSPARVTAFAFGPQNLGWAAFTVLFLASDGAVYALCPVAPFGMRARAAMLRQLPGVNERGTVHTWLLVSLVVALTPSMHTVIFGLVSMVGLHTEASSANALMTWQHVSSC